MQTSFIKKMEYFLTSFELALKILERLSLENQLLMHYLQFAKCEKENENNGY